MAGSLSHPNIVTVHDYFEHDGTPYIAMEYVEGGSLRPWVGRMTLAQRTGVPEGMLAGLTCAEAQGIVHRDLKPENVMVSSHGQVKIADFGIAKATTNLQTGAFQTATGVTIGTPNYMAPEQAMGQQVGPWTDLYSVGCMAFELFTGRVPFHDTDAPMAILMRHVNEPIPPVRAIDPSIDEEISDWIQGLLSKDPAARMGSAAAAWDAYEEFADRLLPRRWHRVARLTGEPGEAPRAATPPPFTPPPVDLPSEPMADDFETYHEPTPGAARRASGGTARRTSGRSRPPSLRRSRRAEPPGRGDARRTTGGGPSRATNRRWRRHPPRPRSRPICRPPLSPRRDRTAIGGGGRRSPRSASSWWRSSRRWRCWAEVATTLRRRGRDRDPDREPGRRRRGGRRRPARTERVGPLRRDRVGVHAGRHGRDHSRPHADRVRPRHHAGRSHGRASRATCCGYRSPTTTRSRSSTRGPGHPASRRSRRRADRRRWPSRATRSSSPSPTARRRGCSATTSRRAPRARIIVANGVERITLRGDILWVLTSGPDLLHRYDATIGTRLSSTEVGEGAKSMVVSDGVFWVTGSEDGSLTRVDEKTQETERFELGGSPQNVRVGLGAVWVTNATKGALQGFDPDTGDVREIPVGERPFSLVLAEDGIWVGDTADNKVRFAKP